MIRVDLHMHSAASFDCDVHPVQLAKACAALGLAPIFITDHDTLHGAVDLQTTRSLRVVAGEEVMTRDGELIGLFLTTEIPPGLPATDTASRIKEQGGLIYLEHPYDTFRRHLSEEAIEAIADQVDIVEVFNGRSDAAANRRAQELCEALGAAPGAGSDSHSIRTLGSVYVEMEDFSDAPDFLSKLRRSRIVKGRNRLLQRAESRLKNTMRRR